MMSARTALPESAPSASARSVQAEETTPRAKAQRSQSRSGRASQRSGAPIPNPNWKDDVS